MPIKNEVTLRSLVQKLGVGELVGSTARMLADLLFPPRCPSCQAQVEGDGNFCAPCFSKLRMIDAPMCHCCGIPFAVPVGADMRCPDCLETAPEFTLARAALVYDAVSSPLIATLKFHDQWAGLSRYVQMMLRAGQPVLAGADMLVPVPLHWRRLWTRRFNQSALLAYGISKQKAIMCAPQLLQRVQYTKPQARLNKTERRKNVRHAFAVPENVRDLLRNKTIVLVDDVVTTGATVNACASVLKKAGAKEVRVLSLARTVKE